MNKQKIFNDPVYGFVSVPFEIVFDLIEHPYFQRLRRITQLGLTHYVYPGALHTRFQHALGALHLMTQAIGVLRAKGQKITEQEAKAVFIAILLHDIGHGPFSHVLEHTLVNVRHETLSLLFMEALNKEFNGELDLAIRIFTNQYPKKFLNQLVSGQLDMDRMDYLNRDSFFTGVSEGVIGYDRIIKMLAVVDGELVVEQKGIYSIEKFLIARRLMYWQVYLHKTVLSAEQMLIRVLRRAKEVTRAGHPLQVSPVLAHFLENDYRPKDLEQNAGTLLKHYSLLDDVDIYMALKNFTREKDFILSFLAKSLINRKLFKVELNNHPFERDYVKNIRQKIEKTVQIPEKGISEYLIIEGTESNSAYSTQMDEIKILFQKRKILPLSAVSDHSIQPKIITKHYLCYPKNYSYI